LALDVLWSGVFCHLRAAGVQLIGGDVVVLSCLLCVIVIQFSDQFPCHAAVAMTSDQLTPSSRSKSPFFGFRISPYIRFFKALASFRLSITGTNKSLRYDV